MKRSPKTLTTRLVYAPFEITRAVSYVEHGVEPPPRDDDLSTQIEALAQFVALLHSGWSIGELLPEFETCLNLLYDRIIEAAHEKPLTCSERDELRRLRHETGRLREERDMWARAVSQLSEQLVHGRTSQTQ